MTVSKQCLSFSYWRSVLVRIHRSTFRCQSQKMQQTQFKLEPTFTLCFLATLCKHQLSKLFCQSCWWGTQTQLLSLWMFYCGVQQMFNQPDLPFYQLKQQRGMFSWLLHIAKKWGLKLTQSNKKYFLFSEFITELGKNKYHF